MSLSKDYILQELVRIEALAESSKIPTSVELLYPILPAFYPGADPVPNPFHPENGKAYLFTFLAADHVIQLPNPSTIEPGFTFDIYGMALSDGGPNRIEIHLNNYTNETLHCPESPRGGPLGTPQVPLVMDAIGESLEGFRLTYMGPMSIPPEIGVPASPLWFAQRLDGFTNVTKVVNYATTGALPAYTSEGEGSTQVLTANSGTLTIDGTTFSSLSDYNQRVLVKDESANINGIYRLTQVNPWRLRRASIDQSDWQVDRRGAIYQVTNGTANAGKQFYQNSASSAIDPVAGAGAGLTNVAPLSEPGPHSVAAGTFVPVWYPPGGDVAINLPDAQANLNKEVWVAAISAPAFNSTITLNRTGSDTLDGRTSYVMRGAYTVSGWRAFYDGINYRWKRVGGTPYTAEVLDNVPIGPTTNYAPQDWHTGTFFNLSANLGPAVINSFLYDTTMVEIRKLIRNRTGNSITIKDNQPGTGKVLTKSGADVVLSTSRQTFEMIYSENSNAWVEV